MPSGPPTARAPVVALLTLLLCAALPAHALRATVAFVDIRTYSMGPEFYYDVGKEIAIISYEQSAVSVGGAAFTRLGLQSSSSGRYHMRSYLNKKNPYYLGVMGQYGEQGVVPYLNDPTLVKENFMVSGGQAETNAARKWNPRMYFATADPYAHINSMLTFIRSGKADAVKNVGVMYISNTQLGDTQIQYITAKLNGINLLQYHVTNRNTAIVDKAQFDTMMSRAPEVILILGVDSTQTTAFFKAVLAYYRANSGFTAAKILMPESLQYTLSREFLVSRTPAVPAANLYYTSSNRFTSTEPQYQSARYPDMKEFYDAYKAFVGAGKVDAYCKKQKVSSCGTVKMDDISVSLVMRGWVDARVTIEAVKNNLLTTRADYISSIYQNRQYTVAGMSFGPYTSQCNQGVHSVTLNRFVDNQYGGLTYESEPAGDYSYPTDKCYAYDVPITTPVPSTPTHQPNPSDKPLPPGGESNKSGGASNNTVSIAVCCTVGGLIVVAAIVVLVLWCCGCFACGGGGSSGLKTENATVMVTSVEHNAELWDMVPDEMSYAMQLHDEVVRSLIEERGCREVRAVGDSFTVACPDANAALLLARDLQQRLLQCDWGGSAIDDAYAELHAGDDEYVDGDEQADGLSRHGSAVSGARSLSRIGSAASGARSFSRHSSAVSGGRSLSRGGSAMRSQGGSQYGSANPFEPGIVWSGLRVRVGIDSGAAEVLHDDVTKRTEYIGDVPRAASSLMNAGAGGQVLVSGAVYGALSDSEADRHDMEPLGTRLLSGLRTGIDVYQLNCVAGRAFPPLLDRIASRYSQFSKSEGGTSFRTLNEDAQEDYDEQPMRTFSQQGNMYGDAPQFVSGQPDQMMHEYPVQSNGYQASFMNGYDAPGGATTGDMYDE